MVVPNSELFTLNSAGRSGQQGLGLLPLIAGVSLLLSVMAASVALMTYQFSKTGSQLLRFVQFEAVAQSAWNELARTAVEKPAGTHWMREDMAGLSQQLSDRLGTPVTVEDEGGKLNINSTPFGLPPMLPGLMDPSSVEEAIARLSDWYGFSLGRLGQVGTVYPYPADVDLHLGVKDVAQASAQGNVVFAVCNYASIDTTRITLFNASGFPNASAQSPVKIVIGSEYILYTGVSRPNPFATVLTGCQRGVDGSDAVVHRFERAELYASSSQSAAIRYGVMQRTGRQVQHVETLEELANIWSDLLYNPEKWEAAFANFTTAPTIGVNINTASKNTVKHLLQWQTRASLGHPLYPQVLDQSLFPQAFSLNNYFGGVLENSDGSPSATASAPYFTSAVSRLYEATLKASQKNSGWFTYPRFRGQIQTNDTAVYNGRPYTSGAELVQRLGLWPFLFPMGESWYMWSMFPQIQATYFVLEGPGTFTHFSHYWAVRFPGSETVQKVVIRASPAGPPRFLQWSRKG